MVQPEATTGPLRQSRDDSFPRQTAHFTPGWGDLSGAWADLGVFMPLAIALVAVNGVDAGALFICAGILAAASGAFFQIPFPVQPLKALTAVAVAGAVQPGVIHAAGLEMAAVLVVVSLTGMAGRISRIFTPLVVRALQFGVGVLLVITALRLIWRPPESLRPVWDPRWAAAAAALTVALVAVCAARRRFGPVLAVLAAGLGLNVAAGGLTFPEVTVAAVSMRLPEPAMFSRALFLLVIPQLPLTFGNAVVAVADAAGRYFGRSADRVTPARICLSAGLGNLLSGLLGGMPMCHGAGGMTAHFRLGATRPAMNLLLGGAFLAIGIFFGPGIMAIASLLPLWALAGFLAYAGVRHAALVRDLSGRRLALAVAAGLAGAFSGNMAVCAGLALGAEYLPRAVGKIRQRNLR